MSQDLLAEETTPHERQFGDRFKGPVIVFGAMVEYHLISAKDQSRLHQFGKKVLPGIFLGYALFAGENLERYYGSRLGGAVEFVRVRKLCPKAQCKGRTYVPKS